MCDESAQRAEQGIARETDDSVEYAAELVVRQVAHDPRPIPGVLARAADAPEREEVVGLAEQRVDLRDQLVGERDLDLVLDGLRIALTLS